MSISAYRDINLLGVEEGVSYGLSGEACASFELKPQKDLRMCPSDEHGSFVGSYSRMLGGLPQDYGMLLEAEVTSGTGCKAAKAVQPGQNGLSPVLAAIDEERASLFEGGKEE